MHDLNTEAIASRHQLLTIKEVRERIRVSQSTIYLWMDKGKFPKPLRLGEACVRWREEDLATWIAGKRRIATGKTAGETSSSTVSTDQPQIASRKAMASSKT